MTTAPMTVLVVGATGSIGRLVVAESIARGHTTRALVRDAARGRRRLPAEAQITVGDVTDPGTLPQAVNGVDAVVLTLGSDGTGHSSPENIDYAGVRNVLAALSGQTPRIVLMTAIGVTARGSAYDHLLDWKRRSERVVRASGLPYTIVRPGWFDMDAPDEHRLVFLQGDTRRSGSPSDGVIAREQIAQVLVRALTAPEAVRRTFELVAEQGPVPSDLVPLFAALEQDAPGALDAVRDEDNMPLTREPQGVRDDLDAVRAPAGAPADNHR
ncbi:SDR family oxidoreductase [Streptomyces acidicola]|uniref:SDR family oxidoreductase n=1 Tax=Streptomyces acidicola TaxID=2596892 RepID=UPI0037A7F078